MSWVRRNLPPAILLLPAILLAVKLLLTPIADTDRYRLPVQVRGWPWVFVVAPATPTLTKSPEYFAWPLLADVAVLLAAIAICLALLLLHRRRGYGWFRFSLRDLLVMTGLVGAGAGWWMQVEYRSHRQRAALESLGMMIQIVDRKYFEPGWLKRLWPHEELAMFQTVTWVRIASDPKQFDDKKLAPLCQLPHLRVVQIGDCPITDDGIAILSNQIDLEWLDLSNTRITDAGVAQLAKLPRLKTLDLAGTAITDRAINTIVQMKALSDLDISFCRAVTDQGAARILELPNLIHLIVPDEPQLSARTHRMLTEAVFERLLKE